MCRTNLNVCHRRCPTLIFPRQHNDTDSELSQPYPRHLALCACVPPCVFLYLLARLRSLHNRHNLILSTCLHQYYTICIDPFLHITSPTPSLSIHSFIYHDALHHSGSIPWSVSTSRWGEVRVACVLRIGNRSGPHVRHRRGQIVMGARARIALILLNTTMAYDDSRVTIEKHQ